MTAKHQPATPQLVTNPEEICPECGGETGVQKWSAAECVHGDTSIRYCTECDWQGDPE